MSHDRYACSKSHSKIHVAHQKVISKGLGDTSEESNCFQQWRSMRALHLANMDKVGELEFFLLIVTLMKFLDLPEKVDSKIHQISLTRKVAYYRIYV